MDSSAQHRLARARASLTEATGPGGPLHGLSLDGTLESLDAVFAALVEHWEDRPPGSHPGPDAPEWVGDAVHRVIGPQLADRTLVLLDAVAYYAGEVLISAATPSGARWAAGDPRYAQAGTVVVVDDRGFEQDMVLVTFAALHAAHHGTPGRPGFTESVRREAELRNESESARRRRALAEMTPRVKLSIRPPRRGMMRRQSPLERDAAADFVRALSTEPGSFEGAPEEWLGAYDPGAGPWTALLTAQGEAGRVAAIDVSVFGWPEDDDVGSDQADLDLYLASVRRAAEAAGLEVVDVTSQAIQQRYGSSRRR